MVAKARTYVVGPNCRRDCGLNPINMPTDVGEQVLSMYGAGKNRADIRAYLLTQDISVSEAAVGNHKARHLEAMFSGPAIRSGPKGKPKTHLEILETIIQRGGSTVDLQTTRISPEMLMKAIEMHHKLTEGSVWEDFLSAIGALGEESAAGGPESPDVVASSDEQAQGAI